MAEAYAQTPAYNYQIQFDQLRPYIRQLESDLDAERATGLKLGRLLDQQRAAVSKSRLISLAAHVAEMV